MPGDGNRDFGGPPVPDDLEEFLSPQRKRIAFILAGCGLVLLTIASIGKGIGPGRYWPWSGLDIDVSKPQLKDGGPGGTFTMYHAAFTGVPSNGFGGACLVADVASVASQSDVTDKGITELAVKGESCTSDAQCMAYCATEPLCNPLAPADPSNPSKPANPASPRQKWWGYCAPDPDKTQRHCWYKPVLGEDKDYEENEKQLCEKSPYYLDSKDPKFDPLKPGLKEWMVGEDNSTPHRSGYDLKDFYDTHTKGQAVRWRIVGLVRSKSGGELVRYGEPAELKVQP